MITEHYELVEPTIRDIAWKGEGKIQYFVNGLKSWNDRAGFQIEVKRETHRDLQTPDWQFKIDNIGYSVKSDNMPLAMKNYGIALADAGAKIELLAEQSAKMEAIFQEGEATRKVEREAEWKRVTELKNSEKPVGKKLAKKMIEHMKVEVKKMGRFDTQNIKIFDRGTHKERTFKVEFSYAGLALFSEGYHRCSKNHVIQCLADSNLQMLDVSGCPSIPDPRLANFLFSKGK
jgi:hypothetical protein